MIERETLLSLYRRMLLVRRTEERIVEHYSEQKMRCPVHLSIGQEATAAGMCEVLRQKDLVVGNHRSHGHYIAKNGSLRKMIAELYGKESGCTRGIGGSMHLIDLENGILATTPIVGGTIPVAVGVALANQMKKNDIVTTLFVGDGATEEGVFHESLNFAILKKLPIIFFCENNLYSVYTNLGPRQPPRPIHQMVAGHGIDTSSIDGNNVVEVYETAKRAYENVREGQGPVFIEASTYRWREHCGPNYDNNIGYRTEEEFLSWKEKCPLASFEKVISSADQKMIEKEVSESIDDAFTFARESKNLSEKEVYGFIS